MTYFKVIENQAAVDAGYLWLRWNARHQCLMACEPREANYAQSYDGKTIYRIGWLNPIPDGAPVYPLVEAKIIDAQEYAELIEILPDEPVPEPPEPEPEPDPDPDPEPEPDPERPMSIQEMREKIQELTSMTAKQNYPKGTYFVLHDVVYQAVRAIEKGTEVKPGYNCIMKSLEDLS